MSDLNVHVHLQRLDDEDALEHGQRQGDDPLNGWLPSILKAVEQSEEGGDATYGNQKTPADKDEPPGQLAASFFLLLLHRHKAEIERMFFFVELLS